MAFSFFFLFFFWMTNRMRLYMYRALIRGYSHGSRGLQTTDDGHDHRQGARSTLSRVIAGRLRLSSAPQWNFTRFSPDIRTCDTSKTNRRQTSHSTLGRLTGSVIVLDRLDPLSAMRWLEPPCYSGRTEITIFKKEIPTLQSNFGPSDNLIEGCVGWGVPGPATRIKTKRNRRPCETVSRW